MPQENPLQTKDIIAYIRKRKALSFDELKTRFQCSYMTILRRKRDIGYITSYNKSNSGMTLKEIPNYNEFGIWYCRTFLFSKWGNMKMTIKRIIDNSPQGLHPVDLQDIMKTRVNNHLSTCVKENLVMRDHDFGHPIYFSSNDKIRRTQYEQREVLLRKKHPIERPPLSKENIIKVLLAIIKHHVTTVEKIMAVLETEDMHFSEQSIKWLLKKYQIEKKGSP